MTNILAILAKRCRKGIKNKFGIRKNCIVQIEKAEYLLKDDEHKSDDDLVLLFNSAREAMKSGKIGTLPHMKIVAWVT